MMKLISIKLKLKMLLIFIFVFIIFVFMCIHFLDVFFGVQFKTKIKPTVLSTSSFVVDFNIPCNRIYKREIGLLFDPSIKLNSISEASKAISGKIKVNIAHGNKIITENVELYMSGWTIDSKGINSKIILRYDPIEPLFCGYQRVSIEATNLNVDLNLHAITIYVSRDSRP